MCTFQPGIFSGWSNEGVKRKSDLDRHQSENGLHHTLKEQRDQLPLATRVRSVRLLPPEAAAAGVPARHLAAKVESEAGGEEDGLQEEESQDAESRVDAEGT